MRDKTVLCVGGPCDGKSVSSALGDRWPYALWVDYGGKIHPQHITSDYVLVNAEYVWENEIIVDEGA